MAKSPNPCNPKGKLLMDTLADGINGVKYHTYWLFLTPVSKVFQAAVRYLANSLNGCVGIEKILLGPV